MSRRFALALLLMSAATVAPAAFPTSRPESACYPRPVEGETVDVSPPGFCWWPAGRRGQVQYRLKVLGAGGRVAYQSPVIEDPAHIPAAVLPAGSYTWMVEALDRQGRVSDTWPSRSFSIAPGARALPWVPAGELLARVPPEHPRLLFPKAELGRIRGTLATTRKEAFEALRRAARSALRLKAPAEPDYDKLTDPAQRRIAYMESFRQMRDYHTDGMVHLALMYVLSGEKKYGEAAKQILLGAAKWDPEGVSSVMGRYGDEIGLGLVKSSAQAYDWIYDLLTPDERRQVREMLIARADQMLRRLQKRDFLARPEESHAGRLPGYLVQHAIVLAEEPRAEVWMDYAMRVFLTVFPHWAGKDGGWAEGVPYGLAYNTTYLMPVESLRTATGFDLWQRPFYRKVRNFFVYQISPRGEIMPFGDTEDAGVPGRASGIRALLLFHALRYQDPIVRGWTDLLVGSNGRPAGLAALPGLLLPDTLAPESPAALKPDAAFHGVGWAALHSDLARPEEDLMVAFKSSPYGGVSHSHCDQNSFALMKGGRALAITGGPRFPTHGSPFHREYAQQTMAHNAILVEGQGQRRGGAFNGHLAGFESTPHLGYVCGDAAAAYGGLLKRARRHVLLVRPDTVVIVDDLAAPQPSRFQWLLHAREKLEIDQPAQRFVSRRGEASMRVELVTAGGFEITQTDAWPMDPKEGFPKLKRPDPAKEWHLTAATREAATARRIAAVMFVADKGRAPEGPLQRRDNVVEFSLRSAAGDARVRIDLATGGGRILEAVFRPPVGAEERISR